MHKITLVYFSPTGNTQKSLEAMALAVGDSFETLDLTVPGDMVSRQFTKEDTVILGAPVYGGRIPQIARERFTSVQGDHTPCLIAATYGNRDFDDALVEMADLAAEQGFVVKGAAALIGRHTFGEIQINRPDADDLAADAEFARKALAKPDDAPAFSIPGNRPYKDGGKGGKFRPLTSDACVKCGLCVAGCPVQAIGQDCVSVADHCISCFRCIRRCPMGAKNMDTEGYQEFAVMFTEKLKNRRENQFFL